MYITPSRSPDTMSVEELLDHIAGRYQDVHRRELPALIALARKVERVHEGAPEAPAGLADALEHIALELDMHIEVEDKVLFRAMRQNAGKVIDHPIAMMRSEHRDYAEELDKLEELAHGFRPPAWASGSWTRLYRELAGICATLREQMRIENDILFPRFEIAARGGCTCAQG